MGLEACLVNEHGKSISRSAAGDPDAFRRATDYPKDYPRIAAVDIYGETILERSDLPAFLAELERLIADTIGHEELQWLLDVRDLAQRRQDAGTRLRFLGD